MSAVPQAWLHHLIVLRLPHSLLLLEKQQKDSADPWSLQMAHTSPSLPLSLKQGTSRAAGSQGWLPSVSLCWWHLLVAGWFFSCRPWGGLGRRTADGKSPGRPSPNGGPESRPAGQTPDGQPEPPNRPRGPSRLHPVPHAAGRSGVCGAAKGLGERVLEKWDPGSSSQEDRNAHETPRSAHASVTPEDSGAWDTAGRATVCLVLTMLSHAKHGTSPSLLSPVLSQFSSRVLTPPRSSEHQARISP